MTIRVIGGGLAGPEAAWITELFPTRYRYTGSSLAFQGSSILAGGPEVAGKMRCGQGFAVGDVGAAECERWHVGQCVVRAR